MGHHYDRGIALYNLRRYKDAADAFSHELAENPNSALAHAMQAAAFGAMGHLKSAEESAQTAIRLAPSWQYGYYILGVTEALRGKIRNAEATFGEAQRIEPTAEVFYRLAKIYSVTHRANAALEATEESLNLEPFHAETLLLRGEILLSLGRLDEAQQLFRTALAAQPDNPNAHHALGKLNLRRGDSAQALDLLREARRLDPRSKNDAIAIALAYGRTLKPFCWIDPYLPRWYLWPHKNRWLLLFVLTMLQVVTLPLRAKWLSIYFPLALLGWVLVFNALAFPHTVDQAAAAFARFSARREFHTSWYHVFLNPIMLLWAALFHLLATVLAVAVANAPELGLLTFSLASCMPFIVGIIGSPGIVSRLICLVLTFVLCIYGTISGLILVFEGGLVPIVVFALFWIITYFANDICNWLINFRWNLIKRFVRIT